MIKIQHIPYFIILHELMIIIQHIPYFIILHELMTSLTL